MTVMKLSKLNIFQTQNRTVDEATLQRDFLVLRTYLANMFPSVATHDLPESEVYLAKDINDYIIGDITYDEKRPDNKYVEELMPFHTRDNVWLAKYLYKLVKDIIRGDRVSYRILKQINNHAEHTHSSIKYDLNDQKIIELFNRAQHSKIQFSHVQKFVETDPEFNAMRNAYEADLVRAQIKFMMTSKKPNGLLLCPQFSELKEDYVIAPVYHPVFTRQERNTDYKFRYAVTWAMDKLGIDSHTTEIALEENANLWRKQTMTDAYYNEYPLVQYRKQHFRDSYSWYNINIDREKNKAAWLSQRENQYYLDHKMYIDELGLATPQMKMSRTDLADIESQVAGWDEHYHLVTGTTKNQTTDQTQSL